MFKHGASVLGNSAVNEPQLVCTLHLDGKLIHSSNSGDS